MTDLSQVTISGYRIIKELGKGGFGTTYLVTPTGSIDCFYALKHFTFPSHNPNNYATAQRLFRREVEILKTLNGHSQIPKFIDYWEDNQEHYLLQEFIPGELLIEELEQGQKSQEYVVKFLTELLEILKFIHSQKIIHRDINPSNIIRRNSDNQLVLIDFGAGAIRQVVTTTTSTHTTSIQRQTPPTRILTPGYAPVEQTEGNPEFNSDIYALGITAIQMLTGIEPQNLQTDINGEIIWLNQAEVSDRLGNILCTMVSYDHRDRYDSVDKILEELGKTKTSSSPTKVLGVANKLDPSQGELKSNQINLILFCLLTCLSVIAILSAAGILPVRFDIKPENRPSSSKSLLK